MGSFLLLFLIIFTPTFFAIALAFLDSKATESLRFVALAGTVVTFFLTLVLWGQFDMSVGEMQHVVTKAWIPKLEHRVQTGC